jgi:hypothetical protein
MIKRVKPKGNKQGDKQGDRTRSPRSNPTPRDAGATGSDHPRPSKSQGQQKLPRLHASSKTKFRIRDTHNPARVGWVIDQGPEQSVVVWDAHPTVRTCESNDHWEEV